MSVVHDDEEVSDRRKLLDTQATALEQAKPTTFEQLKRQPIQCKRCGHATATHTLTLTVAEVGKGRGSTVTNLPRVPVCEGCAVKVFVVVKDALKS
jgi:hypothetical protein